MKYTDQTLAHLSRNPSDVPLLVGMLKWDIRFMRLAQEIGSWSKDGSTKVGVVLVDHTGRIAATGYNGFPSRMDDWRELYDDREFKYGHVVHAEVNAIASLEATHRMYGGTAYVSFSPCPVCTQRLLNIRVRRIVHFAISTEGRDPGWIEFWREQLRQSRTLASSAGVRMDELEG